jgi:hypothetical protein
MAEILTHGIGKIEHEADETSACNCKQKSTFTSVADIQRVFDPLGPYEVAFMAGSDLNYEAHNN